MASYYNLSITYENCYSRLYLEKTEWLEMINKFITSIQTKPLGNKLWNRLIYHLNNGKKLTITTRDNMNRVIFPKTRYIDSSRVLIVIPCINYFHDIDTINKDIFTSIDTKDVSNKDSIYKLISISNYRSISEPIKDSEITEFKGLIAESPQTYFIMFVHELIHCVRFFDGINISSSLEEDATIYGIKNKSLIIDGSEITENSIRKEWGKPPRISHGSKPLFIADLPYTNVNETKFKKSSFTIL